MSPLPSRPSVLVVGCGGIGGVLGSQLLRADVDLTILTTNAAVRDVWLKEGPRLEGKSIGKTLDAEHVLASPEDAQRRYDVAFIAVQPPEVTNVARSLIPLLSERGRVVCLPNGLCEDRVGEIVGRERVVGAVVAWGARMLAPGSYTKTSEGGFRVGTLSGAHDAELDAIVRLLETVGPVRLTDNLRGARFSKLAINCAVSTIGTIGGRTVGELLGRAEVRRLALDILTEAVDVARADGIRLEKVIQLDLEWLAGLSKRPSKPKSAIQHAVLFAVALRYRKMRSSMLAAIERGRPPAVDFLNGEIVARGERLGVATPVNRAARDIVWEIARKTRTAGFDALDETRSRGARSGGELQPRAASVQEDQP